MASSKARKLSRANNVQAITPLTKRPDSWHHQAVKWNIDVQKMHPQTLLYLVQYHLHNVKDMSLDDFLQHPTRKFECPAPSVTSFSQQSTVNQVHKYHGVKTEDMLGPEHTAGCKGVNFCAKCFRKVDIDVKQTRGADEGMTEIVQCENCGKTRIYAKCDDDDDEDL